MRGDHHERGSIFSYVSAEQRIPHDHPLRAIRALVEEVPADMSREFDRRYATTGRPSSPPERLLRAQLLPIFYSIRSDERLARKVFRIVPPSATCTFAERGHLAHPHTVVWRSSR
jgi:transposase